VALNGPAPTGGNGPTNYNVGTGDLYDHTAGYQQAPYPTGQVRPIIEGVFYGQGMVPTPRIQQVAQAPAPSATSTAFTINSSLGPVTIIGALPRNIAIAATVTFASGPATSGEGVEFWAQQTSGGGGAAFQFDTAPLSDIGPPYEAQNLFFSVTDPPFVVPGAYNVWAAYPGDAQNATSTSNIVVLNISGS
jgi:hypothetical protein